MLSWVSSLLSGVKTRNIQSLTVRLGLYKNKPKIFKHNLLTDMKLSCLQILALDDDCRLLKICAAVTACNSEGWPLQNTMSTATEKQRGGGPEPFLWDHKFAESHWHSELHDNYKAFVPFSPVLLSVTVWFFLHLTWKLYESYFTGKDTEATKDRRRRHQTTTKGQIYRKWKDALPPLPLQLLFSQFKSTQWTPTPGRSKSDTAPADKHTRAYINIPNNLHPDLTCEAISAPLGFNFFIACHIFCIYYRSVHHVRFAVPQSLHSVENIHHTLSLGHLAHDAAGTEDSTAPTSISADREEYNLI